MQHPRTVLHVLNSASGGAALSTISLIRYTQQRGIRCAAVCNDTGTPDERTRLIEATEGRTTFTPLYVWNKKNRSRYWKRPLIDLYHLLRTQFTWGSTRQVLLAIKRWQVDLVHTNTLLVPEGAFAARATKTPHIWHIRELIGPNAPFQFPLPPPALERLLSGLSTHVVANSQACSRPLQYLEERSKLSVVPNGIDTACFPMRQPLSQPPYVVGMVANLTSRLKRHIDFIDAVALLPKNLNAEFRIYGHDPSIAGRTDPYVDHLKRHATEVSAPIQWMGHVSSPEHIMSEIDILVHPTPVESFGRTVVEAMCAGLPVVGVRAGGVAEIVIHAETGLLANPSNPKELACHLQYILAHPNVARAMGIKGRARAEKEYTLEAHGTRMLDIYERALRDYLPPKGSNYGGSSNSG